jgi:hypothetical protein
MHFGPNVTFQCVSDPVLFTFYLQTVVRAANFTVIKFLK